MSDMETSVDDDVAIPKKNGEHIEAAEPKDKIAAIKEANKAALEKDEEMDVDENEEPTEKVNGSSTPKKHVTKEPTVMNGGSGGEDEDDALSKDGDDETANDETANNSHDDEMNEDDFSKDGHEDDTSKDVEEASKDGSVANGGNHKTDGEASHTVTDEDSVQEAIPAPPTRRTSPRKAAVNFNASLREYSSSEEEEYDVNEVEEVKDDSSDSILELEAEDPLAGPPPATTEPEKSKIGTNIVTIDDVRALQSLTNSAKKHQESEKPNVVLIDTRTILAGKNTSGVTITPAKPRVLPLGGATIGSGVTISHTRKLVSSGKPMSRGVGLPMGTTMTSLGSGALSTVAAAAAAGYGALHSAGVNSGFTYDKQGQLNDPNLTDDTFVVEAPSFIVPYVYEKPPKESFGAFKESIAKLLADKKKEGGDDKNDKADEEKKEKAKEEDKEEAKEKEGGGDEAKSETSENKENDKVATPVPTPEVKKPAVGSEIFFESQLGKFISNLGMNLVQEYVQQDLLREQTRKSQKDKSASVMHAIMSLKKNLESSKDKNEGFHFELRKCRYCSFRTESMLALESHMETPHMRNGLLRCNYCHFETKAAQEILVHMSNEHNIRGKLERAVAPHQCPQCPFEDSMRGKLTRHKVGCDKRFRGDRNQEPPHDWEPPAKIPKPTPYNRVGRPNLMVGAGTNPNYHPIAGLGLAGLAASRPSLPAGFQNLNQNFPPGQNQQRGVYSAMPQLQFGPRGRGRPVGTYKPGGFPQGFRQVSPGNPAMAGNRLVSGSFVNNQTVNNQASRFGQGGSSPAALLNNLGANSSVTIQSITQRNNNPRTGQPSISITPLPGRGGQASARPAASPQQSQQMALKPGQPTGQGKGGFVICEICDGYIKDLEQLRNHMQWIHKVKIHPKMIYNRPPLNCQKCQFRFFTDQGLERHLLGSHGLVTASMQDLANKGQDSGRCPVCGKVYQWKLLNHVAKDHQKTLKPAHLSYKCTVCTATFGQYKLFENHVYTAHSSGGNKKAGDKGGRQTPQQSPAASSSGAAKIASLKMSDEITIIPQAKNSQNAAATGKTSSPKAPTPSDSDKKSSPPKKSENESDIIELDDEEDEEIDDVEENSESTPTPSIKATDDEPPAKKAKSDEAPEQSAETSEVDSGEEGVEEINDEDD